MNPEPDHRLRISVDVQEIKNGYAFTLHHQKKATTWQIKSLGWGFQKVIDIIDKSDEVLR